MANSIALVEKFLPLIDEVYRTSAKSAELEADPALVQQTADANVIKIAKMDLVGLGNYSKETGFPVGDATLEWETHTFANDRGRRFSIDRMDNEESFGLVAANMVGKFVREYVIPEIDAYRFAKIATKAHKKVEATLDAKTTQEAIDAGIVALQENEVDDSNMVLFLTPTVGQFLNKQITRTVMNGEGAVRNIVENYNGIPIVRVPQRRFYTQITLNAGGSGSVGGYTKTGSSGADINFILMDRNASVNITKSVVAKLFTPDENQNKDAYQMDYRLYHDSFVFDNKANGIYVHHKAAV